jgi:hypothetical protein
MKSAIESVIILICLSLCRQVCAGSAVAITYRFSENPSTATLKIFTKNYDLNISEDTSNFKSGVIHSLQSALTGSPNKVKSKMRHYKRGDTLYYCEVLRLNDINYKNHVLAVFGYAHIKARRGRSKIKIKYVLSREKEYLSTIFYSRAMVLEKKRIDVKVNSYMKKLEKKYPNVKMWGVLDANALIRTEVVSL